MSEENGNTKKRMASIGMMKGGKRALGSVPTGLEEYRKFLSDETRKRLEDREQEGRASNG